MYTKNAVSEFILRASVEVVRKADAVILASSNFSASIDDAGMSDGLKEHLQHSYELAVDDLLSYMRHTVAIASGQETESERFLKDVISADELTFLDN